MKTRRNFFALIFLSIGAIISSFMISSCGSKPDAGADAETMPSPEWPPVN